MGTFPQEFRIDTLATLGIEAISLMQFLVRNRMIGMLVAEMMRIGMIGIIRIGMIGIGMIRAEMIRAEMIGIGIESGRISMEMTSMEMIWTGMISMRMSRHRHGIEARTKRQNIGDAQY